MIFPTCHIDVFFLEGPGELFCTVTEAAWKNLLAPGRWPGTRALQQKDSLANLQRTAGGVPARVGRLSNGVG